MLRIHQIKHISLKSISNWVYHLCPVILSVLTTRYNLIIGTIHNNLSCIPGEAEGSVDLIIRDREHVYKKNILVVPTQRHIFKHWAYINRKLNTVSAGVFGSISGGGLLYQYRPDNFHHGPKNVHGNVNSNSQCIWMKRKKWQQNIER